MFTPSGCKDIEMRKFEFVKRTQFLYAAKTKEKLLLLRLKTTIFSSL